MQTDFKSLLDKFRISFCGRLIADVIQVLKSKPPDTSSCKLLGIIKRLNSIWIHLTGQERKDLRINTAVITIHSFLILICKSYFIS